MTWLAPLNVDSADFVKRSAQLCHIADNLAQRYEQAQLSLQGAEATQATAEQATADVADGQGGQGRQGPGTVSAEGRASGLRAGVTRQVVVEPTRFGGLTNRWAATSGETLARLTGGPHVALDFGQPRSGVVASGYGMRVHPILHVYKLDTGIDYAVGHGEIRAARASKVLRAGYDVAMRPVLTFTSKFV